MYRYWFDRGCKIDLKCNEYFCNHCRNCSQFIVVCRNYTSHSKIISDMILWSLLPGLCPDEQRDFSICCLDCQRLCPAPWALQPPTPFPVSRWEPSLACEAYQIRYRHTLWERKHFGQGWIRQSLKAFVVLLLFVQCTCTVFLAGNVSLEVKEETFCHSSPFVSFGGLLAPAAGHKLISRLIVNQFGLGGCPVGGGRWSCPVESDICARTRGSACDLSAPVCPW